MQLIKAIVIPYPPTKYVQSRKNIKFNENGTIKKEAVHYLTANLFYDGTNFFIRAKVVDYAKEFIMPFLVGIPKLEKCEIEITYYDKKDNFDLDNKAFFWIKIILDLMKSYTDVQHQKAIERKKPIKTLNILPEDTVRYVPKITMQYARGNRAIALKIYGETESPKTDLFNL